MALDINSTITTNPVPQSTHGNVSDLTTAALPTNPQLETSSHDDSVATDLIFSNTPMGPSATRASSALNNVPPTVGGAVGGLIVVIVVIAVLVIILLLIKRGQKGSVKVNNGIQAYNNALYDGKQN